MNRHPKPFPAGTRVSFRVGDRPVACDLPIVMKVFISGPRETWVLVDGKPRVIYTGALCRVND